MLTNRGKQQSCWFPVSREIQRLSQLLREICYLTQRQTILMPSDFYLLSEGKNLYELKVYTQVWPKLSLMYKLRPKIQYLLDKPESRLNRFTFQTVCDSNAECGDVFITFGNQSGTSAACKCTTASQGIRIAFKM